MTRHYSADRGGLQRTLSQSFQIESAGVTGVGDFYERVDGILMEGVWMKAQRLSSAVGFVCYFLWSWILLRRRVPDCVFGAVEGGLAFVSHS